jgi:hypothetical protein
MLAGLLLAVVVMVGVKRRRHPWRAGRNPAGRNVPPEPRHASAEPPPLPRRLNLKGEKHAESLRKRRVQRGAGEWAAGACSDHEMAIWKLLRLDLCRCHHDEARKHWGDGAAARAHRPPTSRDAATAMRSHHKAAPQGSGR